MTSIKHPNIFPVPSSSFSARCFAIGNNQRAVQSEALLRKQFACIRKPRPQREREREKERERERETFITLVNLRIARSHISDHGNLDNPINDLGRRTGARSRSRNALLSPSCPVTLRHGSRATPRYDKIILGRPASMHNTWTRIREPIAVGFV